MVHDRKRLTEADSKESFKNNLFEKGLEYLSSQGFSKDSIEATLLENLIDQTVDAYDDGQRDQNGYIEGLVDAGNVEDIADVAIAHADDFHAYGKGKGDYSSSEIFDAYIAGEGPLEGDPDWYDGDELEESYHRHQKPARRFYESSDEAREVYRRCLKKAGGDDVGSQRAMLMLMEDILFEADPSTVKGRAIKDGDEGVWQSIADRVVDLFKNHIDMLRTASQQEVVKMLLKESRQNRRASERYQVW